MSSDAYDALVERAKLLFNLGRFADCIDFAKQAIAVDPGGADAYLILALAYTRVKGKNRDALTAIEIALGHAPDRVDIEATRAYVLDCLGKTKRAVEASTEALAHNPTTVLALIVRAQAYEQLGRKQDAENDARRALAIEPDNLSALGLLAQCLRRQGRLKESEEVSKSLLRYAPHDCFGLTNAGWLAIEVGNLAAATDLVRSALAIEPNNEFARRTWFEILRRRWFFYRWEEMWKDVVLNLLARDWAKSRWKYLVVIPHVGIVLICLWGLTFGSLLFVWAFGRCSADFLIALDRTTRVSLAPSEWYLTLAKGFIVVPVLLYLMLTQQWLISSLCFVGIVTSVVGLFKLAAFVWSKLSSRSSPED